MLQIPLLPEEPGLKLQKVKTSSYVFYSFLVKVLKYELYVSFFSISHINTLCLVLAESIYRSTLLETKHEVIHKRIQKQRRSKGTQLRGG